MELHRCRFVDYTPAAINAVAFSPNTYINAFLACGRSNGEIEIWNPTRRWTLLKTIPGSENEALESLIWTHQVEPVDMQPDDPDYQSEKKRLIKTEPRLFSGGLNATVTEWDLKKLKPKQSVASNGGTVWCMVTNPSHTKLAIGCEDGCIRILNVADDQLYYERSFTPTRARIVSLAWSSDGQFLVSGSADGNLRKWDATTGSTTFVMTPSKENRIKVTVWAVHILEGDQMIVSGDSLGRIVIWDANLGTMLQTLDHHKADVLCLTGGDATSFYSAGVDRKLNYYKYVEAVKKKRKGESNTIYKWVLAESVTAHAHDVRSLDLCTKPSVNSVISGGVGVQMVACRHNLLKAGPRRLPLNPAVPLISLAPKARMMLSRFDHSVRIWQLGESQLEDLDTITDKELGERIDMKKSFRILLEMQMQGVNNLVASTISQDGQWVAVSDLQHVKLFRIVPHAKIRGRLVARKVKAFSMGENYALLLMFTPDASKLVAVTPNGVVCVVDLTTWQEQTFPISELQLKMQATVRSLDISADGQWIAVGDHANTIYLVQMDPFKIYKALPHLPSIHTAIAFHSSSKYLFITLANNEFHVYDIENYSFTNWSGYASSLTPKQLLNLQDSVLGIATHPDNDNIILLWGSSFICRILLDRILACAPPSRQNKKRARAIVHETDHDTTMVNGKESKQNFAMVTRYQSLLYVGMLDAHQVVAVERPIFHIMQALPSAFYAPRFGT